MEVKKWSTKKRLWAKLKAKAREMRNSYTESEGLLWEKLRRKQLMGHNFRCQHPLDRFIVDFYCPGKKLVIELDGEIHRNTIQVDSERQARLEAFGYRVIRFQNDEVIHSMKKVLEKMSSHLMKNSDESS